MEKISINDIIFATATVRGSIAATLRLSGLNSMAEVIAAIKKELGFVGGLLTITLRNMTQGWSRSKSLYLSPNPVAPIPGKQLTLF
ncbi:MAG: hypothetical protein K2K00_03045 [Muribaculaceae bacterium]|nr:hypothetical protein [Muribaculaceae bacterium]